MAPDDLRAHLERIAQSVAMLPDHESPSLSLHAIADPASLIAIGFEEIPTVRLCADRWEAYSVLRGAIGDLAVVAFTVHRPATAEEIATAEERAREGRAA